MAITYGSISELKKINPSNRALQFTKLLFTELPADFTSLMVPDKPYWFGTNKYIFLQRYETKKPEDVRPERHKLFDDIQVILSGTEEIFYFPHPGRLPEDLPEDTFRMLDDTGHTKENCTSIIERQRPERAFATICCQIKTRIPAQNGLQIHAIPEEPILVHIPARKWHASQISLKESNNKKLIIKYNARQRFDRKAVEEQIQNFKLSLR